LGGLGAAALCAWAGCAPGETVDGPAWPEPETAPFDAGPTVDDDVGPRPTPTEDTPGAKPDDSATPVPVDAGSPTPVDAGSPTPVDAGNPVPVDAGNPVPMDAGNPVPVDAGNPVPMDAGNPEVPVRACRVESTSFDAAMQELDVGPTSSTRLRFTLRGVPGPVVSAALRFDCHDCDHPGEEGYVYVGGRRFALPANAAWDNVTTHDLRIDVTGAVAAGDVTVEFGPGPLSRSFFRIGRVALEVGARASSCPGGGTAPVDAGVVTGNRVTRTMGYAQATYSLRNNWVFRCDANYAYTARGSEHLTTDCPRLYRPDGTRRGTATWRFPAVVTGTYDVLITARHSVNRNPAGALFIVNGVSRRVPQNNELGGLNLHTSTWGRTTLSGDVVVVLDSNNPESDSVSSVTLRPAP
jgi:hypothetical protein